MAIFKIIQMKITIKIDPETLFLVHSILVLKRNVFSTNLTEKVNKSMTSELFEVITKRCFSYTSNPNGKKISLTIRFHLANFLCDIIMKQNKTALGNYEQNKLEMFKNDLHQKLL